MKLHGIATGICQRLKGVYVCFYCVFVSLHSFSLSLPARQPQKQPYYSFSRSSTSAPWLQVCSAQTQPIISALSVMNLMNGLIPSDGLMHHACKLCVCVVCFRRRGDSVSLRMERLCHCSLLSLHHHHSSRCGAGVCFRRECRNASWVMRCSVTAALVMSHKV